MYCEKSFRRDYLKTHLLNFCSKRPQDPVLAPAVAQHDAHVYEDDGSNGDRVDQADQDNDDDVENEAIDPHQHFREDLGDLLRQQPADMSDDDIRRFFSDFYDESGEERASLGSDSENDGPNDRGLDGESWAFSLCLFLATLQLFFNVTDGLILYVLQFLSLYLSDLGDVINSQLVRGIATWIPTSLYKFWRFLHRDGDDAQTEEFKKYVVCKKCFQLYDFKDCILPRV